MEKLSNKIFKPTKMLVCYESEGDHYYESHLIENGKPMEGHPLTLKEAQSISKAVNKKFKKNEKPFQFKSNGILQSNVKYLSIKKNKVTLAWHYPYSITRLKFTPSTRIPSDTYAIPNLLFVVSNNQLYVYAYKGLGINNDTELYHVPLFNIHENANVCLGTVKIKEQSTVEEMMDAWEHYFFDSEFTGSIHNPEGHSKNPFDLWTSIGTNKFPDEVLVSMGIQVKQVIDKLNGL